MFRVRGWRETYCSGNEVGILAMGGVPIASVEDPHDIFIDPWEGFEEPDESMFVIHLQEEDEIQSGVSLGKRFACLHREVHIGLSYLQFGSRRHVCVPQVFSPVNQPSITVGRIIVKRRSEIMVIWLGHRRGRKLVGDGVNWGWI